MSSTKKRCTKKFSNDYSATASHNKQIRKDSKEITSKVIKKDLKLK
jgi:hypothetical protein